MQQWKTTLCDVRYMRVLPSHLPICGWALVACCTDVRNDEINIFDLSLAALRLFLLASVYASIVHTAVIQINMNSIFEISFCECDFSEAKCVPINTVLLLFWNLSAVLRFITRYFGKWSCSTMNTRPSQTPRLARGGPVNMPPPHLENTKIRFGVFRTGVLSSDRRLHSESRLGDLKITC
jgi:hypothetical protein